MGTTMPTWTFSVWEGNDGELEIKYHNQIIW